MEPAFFFIAVFPPPSARTEIFTRFNSTGAWGAANTYKPFLMQDIIRDLMLLNESFYFFCAPM
jgi:hypothetical protein